MRRIRSFVNQVYNSPFTKVFALITMMISFGSAIHKFTSKPPTPVASASTATQSSSGSQSRNLSDGQRDVPILYGSVVNPTLPVSKHETIKQSSTGDRSPNINGVGGNVDIHY
jgi:hypothetical protein